MNEFQRLENPIHFAMKLGKWQAKLESLVEEIRTFAWNNY
jgi:hypothetical protein